ncbi:hypothetical protein ABL78_1182 [Leptomonas seymouri]|uniref:Uncharacterized protein n=1 Tax=Leptomonas seymouri TaxID=5684 RepID=A0A0N0P893_LEPSE|nr:hypothetical protein ABL78_1182 [Leptomonas seymouri]|eukprot:KPI89689.1 hypothetical protein ABL78_1182 [Leptomonas seymouri]
MKSARTPVKAHTRHHGASLLSRVVRHVGATVSKLNPLRQGHCDTATSNFDGTCASSETGNQDSEETTAVPVCPSAQCADDLQPGDILRDLPCFTAASEVAYFSTHRSLCAEVFGFVPGEVFEVMRESGAAALGRVVVVLGTRGGKLYVLGYGESSARALYIPTAPGDGGSAQQGAEVAASPLAAAPASPFTPSNEVRAAMLSYYDAHLLYHPQRSLTPSEEEIKKKLRGIPFNAKGGEGQSIELQKEQQEELAARVADLRADLETLTARAQEEAQRIYTAEQRAFLQRAPDLYVAAMPAITPAYAASDSCLASSSSSSAASVYAAVARGDAETHAVVLLAPRVMATTGTAGWAGEGDITIHASQAGLDYGEGSLSASVVI